jgi:hypothetical protein
VLEFMHKHFLKSYQEKQSRFDTLLLTGRYNCISSAVLYAILGTAVGLEVGGVNTVEHVFCSIRIGDEHIDVETTNAYGFDPGTKTEFLDDFGRATGFAYVPPGDYRDRLSIDIIGLFSILLQNRFASAESSGRYAEAVGLAVDRWVLLGEGQGPAFEDLIIRMLNYGTMFSRAGREEKALAWAELGTSVYGPHPKWNDFVDGVANNLLIKLLRRGSSAGARSRFEELKPRLSAEPAATMELMVSDYELVEALNKVKSGGADSEFLAVLNKSRLDGVVSAVRMRNIEVDWHLYKINQIVDEEGWGEGWHAAEKVISETGSSPLLEKARRIYRSNYKAELYNAAADAYNSRSYDEAHYIVEEAMLEFPDESIFRSLLLNIERAISGL